MDERKERYQKDKDGFVITRTTYVLYLLVLVVTIIIVYFAVWSYVKYQGGFGTHDTLEMKIDKNAVEEVKGETRPVIGFSLRATKAALFEVKIESKDESQTLRSEKLSKEFSAEVALSRNLFGRELTVTAKATDEKGVFLTKTEKITAEKEPEALFKVE